MNKPNTAGSEGKDEDSRTWTPGRNLSNPSIMNLETDAGPINAKNIRN
jgi:hypothetical protein